MYKMTSKFGKRIVRQHYHKTIGLGLTKSHNKTNESIETIKIYISKSGLKK